MSRWAPDSNELVQSQHSELEAGPAIQPGPVSSVASMNTNEFVRKSGSSLRSPGWINVAPFFMSAFFFLSAFFVVFSPLPLLFLSIRKGRNWAWLAALSNALIVGLVGGELSLGFYSVFVVCLSVVLSELIQFKKSLEKTVGWTLLAMGLVAIVWVGVYSGIHHLNPVQELKDQVNVFVDYLEKSVSTSNRSAVMPTPSEMDEWKRSLVLEFPSALAIFSLIMVWANLVFLLKVNPNRVRDRLGLDAGFFKRWKAPEFLVWPTIAMGALLVVDLGVVSDIALNVFKFLMAIYALQGLSILGYFFDLWNIRGFFRVVGFSVALLLMMPLVLSLGFFDLWFDFRGKFRQS